MSSTSRKHRSKTVRIDEDDIPFYEKFKGKRGKFPDALHNVRSVVESSDINIMKEIERRFWNV